MNAVVNPFRPGFAAPPPVLAGRDDLVREMQIITSSTAQAYGSHRVLYGPRGVGKTVLIDRYAAIATARHWGVISVEVRSRGDLYESLLSGLGSVAGISQRLHNSIVERSFEWSRRSQRLNLGVYRAEARRVHDPGDERSEHLHHVWLAVVDELASRHRGVMVLIDEAQNAAADHLNMLGPILQDLSRADHSNVVVFAGLMNLPRHLVANVSYAERLVHNRLGHLDLAATAHAIAVPAHDAGRSFDEDALQQIVAATGGYPYFVQLYAYHAFEAATGRHITAADVGEGAARAQAALEDGMFRTRWESLPPTERRFLHLMSACADQHGVARIADIAEGAGTTTQQWSVIRSRLIGRGVIDPVGHGQLNFAQPGFVDFVRRQLVDAADARLADDVDTSITDAAEADETDAGDVADAAIADPDGPSLRSDLAS